jgi:hypothetical protein
MVKMSRFPGSPEVRHGFEVTRENTLTDVGRGRLGGPVCIVRKLASLFFEL